MEQHEGIQIAESTVRIYVRELLRGYGITKEQHPRSYEAIPELLTEKQMQVDFGQAE